MLVLRTAFRLHPPRISRIPFEFEVHISHALAEARDVQRNQLWSPQFRDGFVALAGSRPNNASDSRVFPGDFAILQLQLKGVHPYKYATLRHVYCIRR